MPPTVTFGNTISAPRKPFGALGDHVAGLDLDIRAEPFQRHEQKIDRPRADGATARQRDPRLAHARDQRRQHPEARAHLGDEIIGRGGVDDLLGGNLHGLAGMLGLAAPLARQRDVHAVIVEDALKLNDVGEMRHILEDQRVLGQKARDHQRKRRVLRARNRDAAVERLAAIDPNAIHTNPRKSN